MSASGNGTGAALAAPQTLDAVLAEREVVICCGPGGVGKTTLAASLALRAAMLGRKAIVCTIDPARRLANALGLEALGNDEALIARERLAAAGLAPKGELSALMLDTKRQFDELIGKFAKTEDARKRILENRFYKTISGNVVGSQEFMAMEKLYELHSQKRHDLIVLDTPPTKHALDFLTAPRRMTDVLDRSILEVLMSPLDGAGRFSLGLVLRAAKRLTRKVDQTVGLQFLNDLAEFFRAFEDLYDGFRERAGKVNDLLRAPVTAFVVVAAPLATPLAEARFFCEKLREFEMPLAALVLNRVHPSPLERAPAPARAAVSRVLAGGEEAASAASEAASLRSPLLGKAMAALLAQEHLALADRARIEGMRAQAGKVIIREVPRFGDDVHDLEGLKRMNEALFSGTVS